MTDLDRRAFLRRGGAFAGAALVSTTALGRLDAHAALATGAPAAGPRQGQGAGRRRRSLGGYGALTRMRAVNEPNGPEYLALPAGFSYVVLGKLGDVMTDGTPTPRNLDGMGAFARPDGSVRLIRNHENRNAPADAAMGVLVPEGDVSRKYDPLAHGGTTSLDVDVASMRLLRHFVSSAGTTVNCAGGLALGGAGWITSEETVAGPDTPFDGTTARLSQEHGYNFMVPVTAEAATFPRPLRAMGRFAHEAVATDPATGIVYETEDAGSESGFYRFIPRKRTDLAAGGRLQMLGVVGIDRYDTTRGQAVGRELPVRWIDIPDPDPDLEGGARKVAGQGLDRGAASFNRLEGIWWEGDHCLFNSTSGGDAMQGQVWEYTTPRGSWRRGNRTGWGRGPGRVGSGTLRLVYESTGVDPILGRSPLDSPDNLNITPRGGVLLCEDDANAAPGSDDDTHPLAPGISDVNRLIGLGDDGLPFEFAVNTLNSTEFAGACFAPNAPEVLFVNIFGDGTPGSGATLGIRGPWGTGSL